MALSYTDSMGFVFDTGTNTAVTARANTEVEVHTAREIDSGTLIPSGQSVATVNPKGIPHRDSKSPR